MQCYGVDFRRIPLDELRVLVDECRRVRVAEALAKIGGVAIRGDKPGGVLVIGDKLT